MNLPDNLHVLPATPVVRSLLTTLRDRRTPSDRFRAAATSLARLVAAQAVNEEPVEQVAIRTPLPQDGEVAGWRFRRGRAMVIPVLRAGEAFRVPFEELLPNPRILHLGLTRDEETHAPTEYMSKLPRRLPRGNAYLVDPMFATGGSAEHGVRLLERRGATRVVYVGLVGAPEAVRRIHAACPDVPMYLASLESGITEREAFIWGKAIGDFGKRFYNSFS